MKLRVFQSDKGDCLLLTSSDKKNMLIDGGMSSSFRDHVAGYLAKYVKKLDTICVTHIDQDHISGVIELFDNEIDWRVYKYQQSNGNSKFKKPKSPKPPKVDSVWHNSFDAQLGELASGVANSAARLSSILSFKNQKSFLDASERFSGYATSKREAYELAQKLSPKLLNIPVNEEFNGELMVYENGKNDFTFGNTKIRLIAPFKEDIKKLKSDWEKWLDTAKGQQAIKKVDKEIEDSGANLSPNSADQIQDIMNLGLSELGDIRKVTVPNLASLMFVAEENGKTMLFTGDGHGDHVERGLIADGTYNLDDGLHFNVIKVPHHGSEHNSDIDFWRKFTADHYVICGNGGHENPDLRVLKKIIQSRTEKSALKKSQGKRKFKLWFNSSSKVTKPKYKRHMKAVERLLRNESKKYSGRLSYKFLEKSSMAIS